jgi:hypothetical protein
MSIRKIAVVVLVLVVAVCLWAQSRPSPITTITLESGHEIVLHPDSTWGFRKAGLLDGDLEDEYITLRDGRILWVKADYTWTYTRQPPKPKWPKEFPAVSVTASSSNPAMDQADKGAKNEIYNKAATFMQRSVPASAAKAKNMSGYLMACLKDEVKENEIEVSYAQAKGWKADAKLSIPAHRVKKIMDCLEFQLTPAPADAAK